MEPAARGSSLLAGVLTKRTNGEWIEVGWIEISSEANDRLVYTYNNGLYYHPPNHPLNDQSFILVPKR
jgi:hypothetical protein